MFFRFDNWLYLLCRISNIILREIKLRVNLKVTWFLNELPILHYIDAWAMETTQFVVN